MLITVFGNISSSYGKANKIDTTLHVHKPYSRDENLEKKIEEHIDMRTQKN